MPDNTAAEVEPDDGAPDVRVDGRRRGAARRLVLGPGRRVVEVSR